MKALGVVLGTAMLIPLAAASAGTVAPGDVAFNEGTVAMSLTGAAGDAVAGKDAFLGRKLGNCLACHTITDAADQPFHGEVGPSLDGIGSRRSPEELRGIVANSKMTFEDTIMPAFYRDTGFNRVNKKFEGKTVLTAQQVEDVVAYLTTLTE